MNKLQPILGMGNYNAIKILNSHQMRMLDAATIDKEPIASIDLMERAAGEIFAQIKQDFGNVHQFTLFCGKGNNGGDGLVLARLLCLELKKVTVYIPAQLDSASPDFSINLARLKKMNGVKIKNFEDEFEIDDKGVAVDALFGTGIKLPLNQVYIDLINRINAHFQRIVSIDINSGLPCDLPLEKNQQIVAIRSCITYCIHSPKLSLLFAETGRLCEKIKIIPIGLDAATKNELTSNLFFLTEEIVEQLPIRPKFSYKQKMGHVLVMAGSKGKSGAAYFCGKAAMEVGAGLVTFACPEACIAPLQSNFPEAMTLCDLGEDSLKEWPTNTANFSVLAIGPGIGTNQATQLLLEKELLQWKKPAVMDADALNCIAAMENFQWTLNTVITPHPGEFDRLTKAHHNSYDRFLTQIEFSIRNQIIIVLKGAYTSITLPNGVVYFNSTGTPAMAKAGSGDVLTGIIAGFMAQGITPETATLLGVYIHGKAGEKAASRKGLHSTNASDLINNIHLCIHQNI